MTHKWQLAGLIVLFTLGLLPADAKDNPLQNRFGTFPLETVQDSGVSGTFSAHDNGDGTTTVVVQLDQTDEYNPWGMFALSDCQKGVALNQRPIFTLPDIENGHKEETIETSAYATFADALSVVIYGISPDGSQSIVACANLGLPAANTTRLTSSDENCTQPLDISLEGDWLAISASVNGNGDIYRVNAADPKSIQRLTTSPAEDFDPTWSPDGNRIAFRSQRDGNDEIYVMNADGSCQVNITNSAEADWSPAWSPDGKHIAFARFFENNAFTDIAIMNTDGSDLERLTTSSGEYPDWSPDGTSIAFATARDGNYEIYVMNADGTHQTRLTDNPAYDMSPAWSPDGSEIAFDTQRDFTSPQEIGIGPEFEIHRINADGLHDIRLTENRQEDRFPAWSANNKIVFSHEGTLWVVNEDGSEQVSLGISGNFAAWRPGS